MKKLTIWLMILLYCQLALAIIDSRTYISAQQYYELGDYYSAKQNLIILQAPETLTPEYALLRGKVHLALGEYKDAHFWLTEYGKNSLGSEPLARETLLGMIYEASLYQEQSPITISLGRMKGNTNSSDSEYAPVLTPDGKYMYLSSLRRSDFLKENIYLSAQTNNVWSEPIQITELCTDFNESFSSLSQDGNTAYLFGYYQKDNTNGDIYESKLNNGRWTKPSLIKEVSSPYYDLQPYVYRDKVMFLTSNRDGNHDNYDLFVSENKNGTWTTPVNLGPVVNTVYDEQTPFLSPDGRYLYFASFGHEGYGGNDIFVSERIGGSWTQWSAPQNMGPIINSVKDDRYYSISPDGNLAYLSSNRTGGMGQEDIYFLDLGLLQRIKDRIKNLTSPTEPTEEYTITDTSPITLTPSTGIKISGLVVNLQDEPIKTDIIWIYSQQDKVFMRIVSSDDMGMYALTLPANATDISYEVNTPGYKKAAGSLEIPQNKNDVFVKITLLSDEGTPCPTNLSINGKVLDENNNPVECTVRWSYIYDNELNEVLVETNKDGAFKLYIPVVSKLKYRIDEPRYAVREEIISLPENVDSYDTIIRLVSLGNEVTISGTITDGADKPLVADVFWVYTRNNESVEYRVTSDVDGLYTVTLPRLDTFTYRVAKANYMQISGELAVPAEEHDVVKDFRLLRLEEEAIFQLDNVQFEFAKAILTPASIKILEPVLQTMKANESLEIELSGHTDTVGSRDINMRLSDARAKAVGTYLTDNGIDAKRVTTKGYGFDKPIAKNDTPEGRAKNRRTELKILGIEYAQDQYDGLDSEFAKAGEQKRVVKTVAKDSPYATSQTGIPIALEDQFKNMILQAISSQKQANLKVDLFIANGKIQSANVRDLMGNLNEQLTDNIADMMLGWKVQTNQRSIYSFTVKK
ncbi:MAG: OmpA family protein [Candidatus Cloacimonas sp.]|jgi:outer membrane protein OmpA-like peptidoglycan-associated protein|nr:OmpA family protein [Candidatus Cloacimonas sp.]